MGAKLHIRVLGRFEWAYEDDLQSMHELPRPATARSQSLLAYLASHRPAQHTRSRLMTMFWGDRPERKARRSLSTALWHIRRCLPDNECIVGDGQAVGFDFPGEVWLDVEQFGLLSGRADIESLQAAADLYVGAFMDGFYDDWIIDERYRLESVFVDLLAQLMDAYEMAASHVAALQTAHRLLQMDPLREDAHRAAMRAYCRLGRHHDALAQYERCRTRLRVELDAEPMAETRALCRAIDSGCFDDATQSPVAHPGYQLSVPSGTGRNPLDVVAAMPLVGRAQEMALLAEAWKVGRDGGCSLLLISGEAGVGKTRLMQEFTAPLHWQGVRVLSGRCYEFERLLPYEPVTEALRSLPPSVASTAAGRAPAWVMAQIARLAPDLFDNSPTRPPSAAGASGEKQARLFEGVCHFWAELATQEPLLLLFEDLHWATDSTLQLLHYLARHLINHPILIVGTLRPEAMPAAHPLATLRRRLERDGLARRLSLPRLSAAAVDALIGRLSGDAGVTGPLSRRLYAETEGNPFYLNQLVKALFEQDAIRLENGVWRGDFVALSRADLPLPTSVGETIQARIGRLNMETQAAIHLAAVVGKKFDFDLLDEAWGQGEEATLAALDDLLRQRLIREGVDATSGDYFFTHHKIQEVIYTGLSHRRRQYLHGQVGLAMEQIFRPEAESRARELAAHFEQAQGLDRRSAEKAITYLMEAGQQAGQQYANEEAIDYYRRALAHLKELDPDELRKDWRRETGGQLHERQGDVLHWTGQHDEARAAYQDALALISEQDSLWSSRLQRKIGKTWEIQHLHEQALQAYESAETVLGRAPDEAAAAWWQAWVQLRLERMWVHYWLDRWQEISMLADATRPLVKQHGTPAQHVNFLLSLASMDFLRYRYAVSERTLDLCRSALAISQESEGLSEIAWAGFMFGFALLWHGELDEAEKQLQAALILAERTGDVVHQSRCLTYLTICCREQGRVDDARDYSSRSLAAATAGEMPEYIGIAKANLAWVAWREGNLTEVVAQGQRALGIWRQMPTGHASCSFQWTALLPMIDLALARSQDAAALGEAIDCALAMLEPTQQLLPAPMTAALEQAVDMWEADANCARSSLNHALELAQKLGYL